MSYAKWKSGMAVTSIWVKCNSLISNMLEFGKGNAFKNDQTRRSTGEKLQCRRWSWWKVCQDEFFPEVTCTQRAGHPTETSHRVAPWGVLAESNGCVGVIASFDFLSRGNEGRNGLYTSSPEKTQVLLIFEKVLVFEANYPELALTVLELPSRKLTYPLEIGHLKRKFIFQPSICSGFSC